MQNDPATLEAEAKELLEQMEKAQQEPSAEATPEEPEPVIEEPLSESEETVEVHAEEETPQVESKSGDDLDVRLAKAEKAMKGAQRRMTQATTEAAELRKQNESLAKTLTELKSQLVDSQRDNKKLATLREEYPEIASPLLDELARTQEEVNATKQALAEQEQQRKEDVNRQAMDQHFARIQAAHPDVQEVTNTSDWALWLEDQDATTQTWIETGTSNDVNAVLSRYKAEMGIRPPTPQETSLERAKAVEEPKMPKARKTNAKATNQTIWNADDILHMPNEEFEKHQAEIMEAYRENRIRG